MDDVVFLNFIRIFLGDMELVFLLEIIFRVLVVFTITLVFLRAGGKRARKQLTPVDMLIIVALGSAVGDAMIYSNIAIVYVFLVVITVITTQYGLSRLKRHWKGFDRFVNAEPTLLVHKGKVLHDNVDKENLTIDELYSFMRMKQISNTGQVEFVYLELSGDLSIFPYDEGKEVEGESIMPPIDGKHSFMQV